MVTTKIKRLSYVYANLSSPDGQRSLRKEEINRELKYSIRRKRLYIGAHTVKFFS